MAVEEVKGGHSLPGPRRGSRAKEKWRIVDEKVSTNNLIGLLKKLWW